MQFPTPHKLSGLAEYVGAKVIGNGDMIVSGINEIHCVTKGDVTYVDHPKYYDKALNSAATFIIIDKEVAAPAGISSVASFVPPPWTKFMGIRLSSSDSFCAFSGVTSE